MHSCTQAAPRPPLAPCRLCSWFQTELPEALKGRQPLQLSKAELVKLVGGGWWVVPGLPKLSLRLGCRWGCVRWHAGAGAGTISLPQPPSGPDAAVAAPAHVRRPAWPHSWAGPPGSLCRLPSPLQMDWKLKRGKWRPNLLKYIQELPAGSAEDATRAAFSVLSKHRAGGGPKG